MGSGEHGAQMARLFDAREPAQSMFILEQLFEVTNEMLLEVIRS
jgi:hypothetical protein